jgi:hypothetical protein
LYGSRLDESELEDCIKGILSEDELQEILSKSVNWSDDKKPYKSLEAWLEDDRYDLSEDINTALKGKVRFYCDEGDWSVGHDQDPEYISLDQARNGLWTKEEMKEVEDLLEKMGLEATVFGGTRMC